MNLRGLINAVKEDFYGAVHDLPNPFREKGNTQVQELSRKLTRDGICILPAYFSTKEIGKLQKLAAQAFDNEIFSKSQTRNGKVYNVVVQNPFMAVPELLPLALDDFLLTVIENYFQRGIALADASLERLPPVDTTEGSYRWHYDIRGKQVKAMILLTDVDEDGQHFTFIKGSHKRRSHLFDHKSRISDEVANLYPKDCFVHGIGPAGSVVLFNTNGIHRGTRRLTYTRENLTVNFNTGHRYLYPIELPQSASMALSEKQKRILRQV